MDTSRLDHQLSFALRLTLLAVGLLVGWQLLLYSPGIEGISRPATDGNRAMLALAIYAVLAVVAFCTFVLVARFVPKEVRDRLMTSIKFVNWVLLVAGIVFTVACLNATHALIAVPSLLTWATLDWLAGYFYR